MAAYFSGDENMIAAYETGDPYSDWARKSNAMPADGDKNSHGPVRAVFKRAALGVIYGMEAQTMSEYVGVSVTRARALLRSHRENFPKFWRWIAAVHDAGIARRELQTVFGWKIRVLPTAKSRTLMNFPMQSNGAEMLRIACCLAVDRGIKMVAPIHDAILVEGPAADIEDVIAELSKCMIKASSIVLQGPTVRVDAKSLHFPERYVDGREGSVELWNTTMRLLEKFSRRKNA